MEENPLVLLEKHETTDLEDVFIKYCTIQDSTIQEKTIEKNKNIAKPNVLKTMFQGKSFFAREETFNVNRCKAQLHKNLCCIKRNVILTLVMILYPLIIGILWAEGIGHDIKGLKTGLITKEVVSSPYCDNSTFIYVEGLNCMLPQSFLCYLTQRLQKSSDLVYYSDKKAAQNDLDSHLLYVTIEVKENFTSALTELLVDQIFYLTDEEIDQLLIYISIDNTDITIQQHLVTHISNSVKGILTDIGVACTKEFNLDAVKFEDPVYGSKDMSYGQTGVPAFICIYSFFFTITYTAGALMDEKREGFFKRNLIVGMSHTEIMVAHLLVQFVIMIVQDVLFYGIFSEIYWYPFVGSFWLSLVLMIAYNIVGIAIAFLITELFQSELMVTHSVVGVLNTGFVLGGILWPQRGYPYWLRITIYFLPVANFSRGLQSVLIKGSTIVDPAVYGTLMECAIWTIFCGICTTFVHKFNRKTF